MIKRESEDEHNDDADNYDDDVITMNTMMSKVQNRVFFWRPRKKKMFWGEKKKGFREKKNQKTSDFTGLPRHQTQAGTPSSRVKKWLQIYSEISEFGVNIGVLSNSNHGIQYVVLLLVLGSS
jgi:hypothetical protein